MKPKIKSTEKPDVKLGINDWFKYIHSTTKKVYSGKNK